MESPIFGPLEGSVPIQIPEGWMGAFNSPVIKESPSSMSSFVECPLKWFLERHSPLKIPRTSHPATIVGTFAHRVLEVFYNEPPELRTPELLTEILENSWVDLKNGDTSKGLIDSGLIKEFNEHVDLRRFRFKEAAETASYNILGFEDPKEVNVTGSEIKVNYKQGRVLLRGKIDRIQRTDKGVEIIEDYKTGKLHDKNPDINKAKFLPAGLYMIMREQSNTDVVPDPVGAISWLYTTQLARLNLKATDELLSLMRVTTEKFANRIEDFAKTGVIEGVPARTRSSQPCRFCPVKQTCPAWNNGNITPLKMRYGME